MRVLLALLHARASMTAQASHALRTLAVKCLVGLAHDPAMRHILSKLQARLTSSAPRNIKHLNCKFWLCKNSISKVMTIEVTELFNVLS